MFLVAKFGEGERGREGDSPPGSIVLLILG